MVKALLPLTARSAPNKIEKQSIANGTIDLIKSCNLHGATGDWSQRDAGPCRQVFLSWGSLKMTTNGRRHANPVALQQDGGGPEVRTVIGRLLIRVSPGLGHPRSAAAQGYLFASKVILPLTARSTNINGYWLYITGVVYLIMNEGLP